MKTYEEFVEFLEEHLSHMTDFVAVTETDFHPVCFATARFLLDEPYNWEKKIIDWPSVPKPPKPTEEEMLNFFTTTKGMKLSFRKELKENNLDALYKAYDLLFPSLVTKDEFLTSIFRDDLKRRRYKKVFKASNRKIKQVKEHIGVLKKEESFIALMRQFTKDLSGFSLTLINNRNLLEQAIQNIMKKA